MTIPDASDGREHAPRGEQLAGQAPAPGAECRPDGELLAPLQCPGELQAAHVDLGDREQQRHRREQGAERRAHFARRLVLQLDQLESRP